MKNFYIIMIALVIASSAMAQTDQPCSTCLQEGITFTTQAQIDSFQISYPNCTEILGDVYIGTNVPYDPSSNITNLNNLSSLNCIRGSLAIVNNDSLMTLTGLDNLDTVSGSLGIASNDAITSLLGLDNLKYVGKTLTLGFVLLGPTSWLKFGNSSLINLMGLNNLTSIDSSLFIIANYSLSTLTGLNNLESINGKLNIWMNDAIYSLSGMDNIEAGTIYNIYITENPFLSTCDVQSICDYLAAPNGTIEIHDNATGCNSQEEVHLACTFNLDENGTTESRINIFPNPASTTIIIPLMTNTPNRNTFMTLYCISGHTILSRQITEQQTVVDVSGLPKGVYLVKLTDDRTVMVGKFVKQ